MVVWLESMTRLDPSRDFQWLNMSHAEKRQKRKTMTGFEQGCGARDEARSRNLRNFEWFQPKPEPKPKN